MLEKDIETAILNRLFELGIFAWKNHTTGTYDAKSGGFRRNSTYAIKGVSDILGVLPNGRFMAIEVKSMTGRVSLSQKKFLGRVEKLGGIGFVARSVKDVEEKLSSLGFYS